MLANIEERIWHWGSSQPDKIAIKCGRKNVSYRELCERILGAKHNLDSYNLKPNDIIVLAAGKEIEFIYIYFGAHLAGLRVVPIDPGTNPTRLNYILQQTNPSLLIGFGNCRYDNLSVVSLKDFSELKHPFYVPEFAEGSKIADILFTTGTTGKPKGVSLTYDNESAAVRNINSFIGNDEDDVELLALPVSHSFGLGRIRCCLFSGSTLILAGSFANIKKIYRLIEEERVTGFTMVPASWRYLKKLSGNRLGQYASHLRYIEMGSASFSPEEKKELAQLLPKTRICMHYGLTEASRSAFMEFHDDLSHIASVGKQSPFTSIKIFDENGDECKPYNEGEICIKGEQVMAGYLSEDSQAAFISGYFRTGDWGFKDEEGFIYLSGRKKDLINVGGKKVSPQEVEDELLKIDGIEDCACLGIPDKEGVLGEVVKAFIVRTQSSAITPEDIKNQLCGRLEPYKIPVSYEWISEIPKTYNGKIQRNLLK